MITREHLQSLFGATSIAGIPVPQPTITLPKSAPGQKGNNTIAAVVLIGGILFVGGIILYNIRESKKEEEKKNDSKFKK